MRVWLINGRPGGEISADDRGLAYGDGLFETVAIRQSAPRFIDRHFTRLARGCQRLGFPEPPLQTIGDEVAHLIAGHGRGTVKIIVTRGAGPRGYRISPQAVPTRLVGFDAEANSQGKHPMTGARVVACRTPASFNPALAGLKTLNRLDNVLARSEWQSADADEGLMWDYRGCAVGGTMSNLFVVREGRVLTPALDGCGVSGVMRAIVVEVVRESGLTIEESQITRWQVEQADEIFLTNALIGLWPVTTFESHAIAIGPVTRAIATGLHARGIEEAAP